MWSPPTFLLGGFDMTYKRKGRQERGSTREVKTRISVSEYEEWKHRADLAEITVAEYIRSCVRDAKINVIIKNEIKIKPLVDIAAQYGKIGSNLNQIARYLNSTSVWSQKLLANITDNLQAMYITTKQLAKVVDEINGDYKTQGNEKFRL